MKITCLRVNKIKLILLFTSYQETQKLLYYLEKNIRSKIKKAKNYSHVIGQKVVLLFLVILFLKI